MPTKDILVLANSRKLGGWCVAGREVVAGRPGPWVRPVSSRPDESLAYLQTGCEGGRPTRVGDVVRVPLAHHAGDPFQPENWRLAPGVWQHVSSPPLPRAALVDHPPGLWLEPDSPSADRISEGCLRRHPPTASLYVIRPEELRFSVRPGRESGDRIRCLLRYHGVEYDLSLTDPVAEERYHPFLAGARRSDDFAPAAPAGILVCVSLGLPFKGHRYKIAATLLEGRTLDAAPADARLFTVGHSNHEMARFLDLLKRHGIEAVADVRSVPASRYTPHFNREALVVALRGAGIKYVFLGEELGARRPERECYVEGKARYERIVHLPLFQKGVERVLNGTQKYRVALMCAEKDPLTCHRAVLVCRELARGVPGILHILADGKLESHAEAEERLMGLHGLGEDELFRTRAQRVEAAYAAQGERICYSESGDQDEPD